MKSVKNLVFALTIALPFLLVGSVQAKTSWFPAEVQIISVHEGESIQTAIDKAKPGGVILVSQGVYFETIKLKKNITLRSESGPEQTTIDGKKGPGTVVEMAVNSTLDGFTVTGRTDTDKAEKRHAVECVNIPAVIKNNIVRDNRGTGIYVSGKNASAVVSNNRVFDNKGAGIAVTDHSKAHILENQSYGNSHAGIGIQHGAAPKVEKNKCFQNQMSGIGIRHKESAPLIIGNECYNNELAGVGLEAGANATIKNNSLHENGRTGLGLRQASTAIIEGNKIEKNTISGIGVTEKSTVTVKNNQINHNTMAGMTVLDGAKAIIENNTFKANGTQGIVCSVSHVIIRKNKVVDNIHHGISFYRGAEGEVSENIINNNGANDKRGAGILVVSSNKPVIHHNEFNKNYGPGVYTHRCSPLIENNIFLNDLVFVKHHAAPTVRKNIFYSRGKSGGKTVKSGVDVRESSHPIIAENEFYGKFAISIRSNSNPLVIGNKFSGSHKTSISSARSGVKIDRTAHPSIVNNIFYNGNHLLVKGKYIAKNVIITRGPRGVKKSMTIATEINPKLHAGNTVMIAGNRFIGAKKKRRKRR